MRRNLLIMIAFLTVAITTGSQNTPNTSCNDICTKLMRHTMVVAQDIKPGMLRSALGKEFVQDGGMKFIEADVIHDRYVDRKFHMIKIDVDLKHENVSSDAQSGLNDIIVKVSKPYLEMEGKD